MRLHETFGRTDQPAVGGDVTVSVGMVKRRTVPGKIVRVTSATIVVKYQPSGPNHWAQARFWKKNGRRYGDADFSDGPMVSLGMGDVV
jgi:hypothetical protein